MSYNGPLGPLLSLVLSVTLALVGWWSRQRLGPAPASLSSIQIGVFALSALLLVYGSVGVLSVWIEGRTLRAHRATEGLGPLLVGVVLSLAIAVLAAFLVRANLARLRGAPVGPRTEGAILGGIFLACAAVVAVYRKYFMPEQVVVEDKDTEVPW